jgi:hypothetical protein
MLEGFTVVELATYLADPARAGMKANWDEVIKGEAARGDPIGWNWRLAREGGSSPSFGFDNRGKRSIVLDCAALSALNLRLVYARVSGYGLQGPLSNANSRRRHRLAAAERGRLFRGLASIPTMSWLGWAKTFPELRFCVARGRWADRGRRNGIRVGKEVL